MYLKNVEEKMFKTFCRLQQTKKSYQFGNKIINVFRIIFYLEIVSYWYREQPVTHTGAITIMLYVGEIRGDGKE